MDYRKSLEQAVIYIEANLRENIRVEEVARAAGYSYYHLNRQFYSLLGETIGSYIKNAALPMEQSGCSIQMRELLILQLTVDLSHQKHSAGHLKQYIG
ncbi:AraC family transcriptional regulator [Lacrimispora xylanisolvens]|uniref:AraC family transcriptional regulator n=1 Tax=Lacrimispora xylanisolvens TaxID=384636 RepID=UPI0032E7F723